MRRKLLISLAGLGLALLACSGTAQADDQVSFGIRPIEAPQDRPQTLSYFSYSLEPGAVVSDEALVVNSGDVLVTLKLYAADGITAVNGGTAFAQESQESTGLSRGVSRWLSLSVTEIASEPGERTVVPFTINVPSDASPGHHVAGLVLEAPPNRETPPAGDGEAQFSASVIRQAGVAVVIDVPGPHIAGLKIAGAGLRQQDDQGATFVIAVRNTGNIFVKGEGSLLVADRNGEELASIPLKMDTVLPGDVTTFQVTHPVHLADGDYLLTVALNYNGEAAVLERVEVKVKDGQPELPKESMPPQAPPEVITLTPAEEEGGPPIGRYAAIGAALLTLALAAALVILWRRRRARQPE